MESSREEKQEATRTWPCISMEKQIKEVRGGCWEVEVEGEKEGEGEGAAGR